MGIKTRYRFGKAVINAVFQICLLFGSSFKATREEAVLCPLLLLGKNNTSHFLLCWSAREMHPTLEQVVECAELLGLLKL